MVPDIKALFRFLVTCLVTSSAARPQRLGADETVLARALRKSGEHRIGTGPEPGHPVGDRRRRLVHGVRMVMRACALDHPGSSGSRSL